MLSARWSLIAALVRSFYVFAPHASFRGDDVLV
jgi:hypothetical protein